MKDCCINFLGAGISMIHYCSGDLWNATTTMDKTILCKFCPVCGTNLTEVINEYPKLAKARGMEFKEVLILEDLKNMEPKAIIAKGEALDSPIGINMTNSGKMLRWIAVRGVIHDWCIYCYFANKSYEWIRGFGDKVRTEETIKRLVPCSIEAFEKYRY